MAIDDILRALEEQAQADIEQILADARAQAEAIMAQARDEATDTAQKHVDNAERVTRAKAAQTVNAARLESKKRVAAVKEGAVQDVFVQAQEALERLRETDGYPALLKALAEEALAGTDANAAAEVQVDSRDVEVAKRVVAEIGADASVSASDGIAGGLVVVLDGGRVFRRNTLRDRLAKVRQYVQADVAEILFS